jgi:hypothetical protein
MSGLAEYAAVDKWLGSALDEFMKRMGSLNQ